MQLDTLREGNEKNIVQEPNPSTSNYAVISLPGFPSNRLFSNSGDYLGYYLRELNVT